MSAIFGGKKSQSTDTSSNQAYSLLRDSLSPALSYLGEGASGISRLLGGDASGFNAFKQATGFDQALQAGSRGITGNAAAGGLLRSGSTGKALGNYTNQMQNQYANNYLQNLLGLSGIGAQAGQIIGGAGATREAKSTSKEKPGLGGFLGQASAGAAASDRRLKKNIEKVGEYADGLNIYDFEYIYKPGKYRGVMADEVEKLRPWALGPEFDGFKTVDYSKLER